MEKIINKIQKKIDAIEILHDKESLMCEEVKDLLEELRENQEEDNVEEEDFEEDFDEEEIDEDEDK